MVVLVKLCIAIETASQALLMLASLDIFLTIGERKSHSMLR